MNNRQNMVNIIILCILNTILCLISILSFVFPLIEILVFVIIIALFQSFEVKTVHLLISYVVVFSIILLITKLIRVKEFDYVVFVIAIAILIIFELIAITFARTRKHRRTNHFIFDCSPDYTLYKKITIDCTQLYFNLFNNMQTEQLMSCFSKIAVMNKRNDIIQQIQNSFDFLDGAITRYEIEDITTSEHCNEESWELDFYCCYPKYLVKTDTNKEYSFTFCYHCLWTKHEDCTGIGSIRIEDKASGESIAIGYFEYPYGDY